MAAASRMFGSASTASAARARLLERERRQEGHVAAELQNAPLCIRGDVTQTVPARRPGPLARKPDALELELVVGDLLPGRAGARGCGDPPGPIQGPKLRTGVRRQWDERRQLAADAAQGPAAQRPDQPRRQPRLQPLAQRRQQPVAHRDACDREAKAGEHAFEEATPARLIEVDEMNAAISCDHDVVGPQVVVTHAPARQRPHDRDQAQHDQSKA
ncbi:MAG: hypothetical protein ACREJ5_09445 [Geminicoccaceae bacterium]